jgi:P pilus assembly chaperone PapD
MTRASRQPARFTFLQHRAIVMACVTTVWLATPPAAVAQESLSIEVTPLRVELKLGSGATHTQVVTLHNDAKNAVKVRARVDDWYLSKDGTPQFKPADPADPFSAAAWLRVNPPEQLVAAGATAIVRFTTTVPAATKDGGYRCAVMFEFDRPDADPVAKSRDVMFRGRVATLLYATVGNPVPNVDLTDLQIRSTKGEPPTVLATLTNASRTHVRTKGTLFIYDAAGKIVRQVAVPNVPVLPESERDVAIPTAGENESPLPPGKYRVEVKIDVGQPAMIVGETTMEIAAKL